MLTGKIYIDNVTSEELAETEIKNFSELIEILEKNNPDSVFFFDVNLSVLLEYLHEGGYNDNDILKLNQNIYGNFIDFYYLTDFNLYVMEFGAR